MSCGCTGRSGEPKQSWATRRQAELWRTISGRPDAKVYRCAAGRWHVTHGRAS